MSSVLELYESRIDRIEWSHGAAIVHFSHASILRSHGKPGRDPASSRGSSWSREAELTLHDATIASPPTSLPNSIDDGYLLVGGIRHAVLPLPFRRKVDAQLMLQFADGSTLDIHGTRPVVTLHGAPIYLEDV